MDALSVRLDRYHRELAGLWPGLSAFLRQLERLAQDDADLLTALAEEAEHREWRETTIHDQAAASVQLATLEESAGKTVADLFRELDKARAAEKHVKLELKTAQKSLGELKGEMGRLLQAGQDLTERLTEAETVRAKAVESFRRFAVTRLLAVAHGDFADLSESDCSTQNWSPTRAVAVARDVETRFKSVTADDDAWNRIDGRIHAAINTLITELGSREPTPYQEKFENVMIVKVTYQGRDRSMDQLLAMLQEQLQGRRELLSARERQVIENHLIGEVTQHLHDLLHQCEKLVGLMNAELEKRPTSSGMALKFQWVPIEDGPPGLAEARSRLMRAGGAWSLEEREALGAFLQQRINEARADDDSGAWHDHLHRALDYRHWHKFTFKVRHDGRWQALTKRTHGQKSGGEKVVALILLQFAAAAAHYQSGDDLAPRLILLDEAFVGVDDQMRGRCMALLKSFDLDFIMTSERETGCYASMPGVAICQLAANPGIDAVHVERYVWNGKEKKRDEG